MLGQSSLPVFCVHLLCVFVALTIMESDPILRGWKGIIVILTSLPPLLAAHRQNCRQPAGEWGGKSSCGPGASSYRPERLQTAACNGEGSLSGCWKHPTRQQDHKLIGQQSIAGRFYSERRPSPARALHPVEREVVLSRLHEERFQDRSPAAVYATLLDEGEYHCSIRTMYRLLEAQGEVRERRDQLTHPPYQKPELMASAPNRLWSWDITTDSAYCCAGRDSILTRLIVTIPSIHWPDSACRSSSSGEAGLAVKSTLVRVVVWDSCLCRRSSRIVPSGRRNLRRHCS